MELQVKKQNKYSKRLITLIAVLIIIGLLILLMMFINIFVKPSNNRNWEVGFETLPQLSINDNQVMIRNLRDFDFEKKSNNFTLQNRTVPVNNIKRVWFLFEPFSVKPLTNFKGVAHTYFVFDITDQDPIAVSVEARKEKGEKYNAWLGFLNKYELIYMWSTEKDQTVRRVIKEHNKLFMYPLKISQKGAEELFINLALTSQQLESNPRFYNTVTSNCTNELAKIANKVKPNSIPFDKALLFPGYSVETLYNLAFIPNNLSLEELQKKYYISDLVQVLYNQEDFSNKLRQAIIE